MDQAGPSLRLWWACLFLLFSISHSSTTSKDKIVCLGTENKFSQLGTVEEHYSKLKKMYNGCEIVLGNLEITHLSRNHDPSFLKDIKEVGGYVLFAVNLIKSIPLTSLQVIRGNALYRNASLSILSNDGLDELPMRNLKEILRGGVNIGKNPRLCNLNTVMWEDIISENNANISVDNSSRARCPKCDMEHCNESCWGPGPENCQILTKLKCAEQCPGRCRGPMPNDCCHSQCAAGCTGPKEKDCLACRKFRDGDTCRESCPSLYVYNTETYQIESNPEGKYSFGTFCVTKCPHNYIVTDLGSCVRTCQYDSYEVEENGVRYCKKCDGPCTKDVVCDGLGHGKLKSARSIDAKNIVFFENCTKIEGSISILMVAKRGDVLTKTPPLNPERLSIFKTIKEITGFLLIQYWPADYTDLSVFENLEIIRGRKKHLGRYSLSIMSQEIKSLGLQSLKEISDGDVIIKGNKNLCYVNSVNWTAILRTNQNTRIEGSYPEEECIRSGSVCHPLCSDQGCWGPGTAQCLTCQAVKREKECVPSCNINTGEPREYIENNNCLSCHRECLPQNITLTCIGPGADQCMSCAHYIDDDTCVHTCPPDSYDGDTVIFSKYPDQNGVCQLCSPECKTGCTGPGIEGCKPPGDSGFLKERSSKFL